MRQVEKRRAMPSVPKGHTCASCRGISVDVLHASVGTIVVQVDWVRPTACMSLGTSDGAIPLFARCVTGLAGIHDFMIFNRSALLHAMASRLQFRSGVRRERSAMPHVHGDRFRWLAGGFGER